MLKQLEKKEMPFYGSLETSAPLESSYFLRISTEKSLNYKTSTCESST